MRAQCRTAPACLVLFAILIPPLTKAGDAPAIDLIAVAHAAESITADQAQQINMALLKSPADDQLHAKLLGYYLPRKTDEHAARAKQIVWMIDHHAADPICGSAYCLIDATDDAPGYAAAKAAWDKQFGANSGNAALLTNGAAFLARNNFADADSLLQQAIALEPKSPILPVRLAELYERQIKTHSEDAARLSALALQWRQSAYILTKDPPYRFHVMMQMPADALRSGDLIQSKRLATQLLGTAAKFKTDPTYGDAIHQSNIVLGETALQAGKIDEADEYLAAAAQVPTSPTLTTTGPDFHLAKDLLAHGERTAVHDYLDACGKFWTDGTARLKAWTATLDAGGTPDF